MKNTLLIFVLFALPFSVYSQNIFPVKLNNCIVGSFCLDCGDEKAHADPTAFIELIENLNKSNDYPKLSGELMFQVLVDSLGKGCVLSHNDKSDHAISKNVIQQFNNFKGWIPAKTAGKVEGKTSFNVSVSIKSGVITSKIERVDIKAFFKSFDKPTKPEILKKDYIYKNENLKNYKIKVWNTSNSDLPNNFNNHITIDKKNTIWLTVEGGLMKFDGKNFIRTEPKVINEDHEYSYYGLASDQNNLKWVYFRDKIYAYNDENWSVYDPDVIGVKKGYDIMSNEKSGEVFFCSEQGIAIHKGGVWTRLAADKINQLQAKRIDFAKRDIKNRLWVGTDVGSALIDENGKVRNFNSSEGILKHKSILSMDEDEHGNIYLSLQDLTVKKDSLSKYKGGIAIYKSNGEITELTIENSALPTNTVSKILYDRLEKVLWIVTSTAGLLRYDLKDGWEAYHYDNSNIPTSMVTDMAFDNNGTLYLTTRQGLVRVEKLK